MSIVSPLNTSMMNEVNNVDYNHAYRQMEKGINKRHKLLYCSISQATQLIAKTLFLSIYEVNKIECSYLKLWIKHPENSFVYKNDIAMLFLPQNRGFVNNFFPNDQVSCNDYVLFICFFLFYDVNDILTVLLAMCGVNSNILISKEKVRRFFVNFSLVESDYADLFMLLNQSKASMTDYDSYPLKVFVNYFKTNFNFSVVIHTFKQDLSKVTSLDEEDISIIEDKRFYYNKILQDSMNISETPIDPNQAFIFMPKPPESCFSKIYRKLCTTRPNPYHYDFFIYVSPNKLKATLLSQLKQKFGYSGRGNSYQSLFMSPRLNVRISTGENSKTKKTSSKLSGKCFSSPSLDNMSSLYSKKNLPNT